MRSIDDRQIDVSDGVVKQLRYPFRCVSPITNPLALNRLLETLGIVVGPNWERRANQLPELGLVMRRHESVSENCTRPFLARRVPAPLSALIRVLAT